MGVVTTVDMRHFAKIGYQASVAPCDDDLDSGALATSVTRVLEQPSARLATAAAMGLHRLAESDSTLALLSSLDLSENARRRLGYLAERVAVDPECSTDIAQRLIKFASSLQKRDDSTSEPLTFLAQSSVGYLRQKVLNADEVNYKWNVYGDILPIILRHGLYTLTGNPVPLILPA